MLSDILTLTRVSCRASGSSKKKALEHIAHTLAADIETIDTIPLFKQLVEREQLGSTGLGGGIAIPHCRSTSVSKITGCLVSLQQGVDFEASDDKLVDLLFALVVPETETTAHLDVLASLAGIFSNQTATIRLRSSESDTELFNTFMSLVKASTIAAETDD